MANGTLEEYLSGDYHQDMDDIRQLEETLERAANMFILAQSKDGIWPYLHRQSVPAVAPQSVSQGTQAMIAVALARMTNGRLASGRSARLKLGAERDILVSLYFGGSKLAGALSQGLRSRSFGLNDPVTLSHIADLLDATSKIKYDWYNPILSRIREAENEAWQVAGFDPRTAVAESDKNGALLRHLPLIYSHPEGGSPTGRDGEQPDRLVNAFVPLRIARSVIALSKVRGRGFPNGFEPRYRRFFESSLHEQLSYSDIPDSRFDPAELIFCLEGLILMAPDAVDDRLFDRVLNVLESKQDESAHWRPSRPIYATKQGMTMLPVSVEGAVSLMRSISIKKIARRTFSRSA